MADTAIWREDIDAVEVAMPGCAGKCFMHRLAFRTLLAVPATADACLAYATQHLAALQAAALAKVAKDGSDGQRNISITSRDLRRALAS